MRRASTAPSAEPTTAAVVEELGLLCQTLEGLDAVLAEVCAELTRRARTPGLAVTEGPFTGEPMHALATATAWATRARTELTVAERTITNVHIAAAGLAEAPEPNRGIPPAPE
jgi:hypothetical protein